MLSTCFRTASGTWAWELLGTDGTVHASGSHGSESAARLDSRLAFYAAEQRGGVRDLADPSLGAVRFGGSVVSPGR